MSKIFQAIIIYFKTFDWIRCNKTKTKIVKEKLLRFKLSYFIMVYIKLF